MIDYNKAANYWNEKNKLRKELDPMELMEKIETFINSHNTLALGTSGDMIRVTPVEYFYYDGNFYIFTEGGKKFANLENDKHVAFAIYENYKDWNIESLQADAYCTVVDFDSDEYTSVFAAKGLNLEKLKAKGNEMYLLRLEVLFYEYLNTSLMKDGYNAHQFKMMRV